ncbi:hypothetical protein [Micrococcus cohnii]|uniref:Uncharacterized protein n=1 Tax=Micrococcus cohnii TaxID=993416 RepID=A0A7W7GPW3_9MICC|nr:hypothetical protein [Micrococcus cohnii]MBB4736123.1 hypothetical protein [Micrococcus cohnii]
MGLKDLFTGRTKDDTCCGTQIVPDDDTTQDTREETPQTPDPEQD